jgi:hypothetical protein
MCFITSAEYAHLEQTKKTSTLKHQSCRKYFIENLNWFSQGNNVLDAAASNKVGFLCRDTCVSSTELNNLNRIKHSISPPWKLQFAGSIPFKKLTQFSHGSNVLDANASNPGDYLWRDTRVSSTQLKGPIMNKMSLSPPWKLWLSGSIPFKNYLSSY